MYAGRTGSINLDIWDAKEGLMPRRVWHARSYISWGVKILTIVGQRHVTGIEEHECGRGLGGRLQIEGSTWCQRSGPLTCVSWRRVTCYALGNIASHRNIAHEKTILLC